MLPLLGRGTRLFFAVPGVSLLVWLRLPSLSAGEPDPDLRLPFDMC
ncbi:hypothetical protein [Actinomadura macra]|nr:hypothetical protein [Actinomadura macra]